MEILFQDPLQKKMIFLIFFGNLNLFLGKKKYLFPKSAKNNVAHVSDNFEHFEQKTMSRSFFQSEVFSDCKRKFFFEVRYEKYKC